MLSFTRLIIFLFRWKLYENKTSIKKRKQQLVQWLELLGKNRPKEHMLFILYSSTFFQTCFYITWQVITPCLWLQLGRTANIQMQIKNSLQQTHYCIVMASLLLTPINQSTPFGLVIWTEKLGGEGTCGRMAAFQQSKRSPWETSLTTRNSSWHHGLLDSGVMCSSWNCSHCVS